MFSSIQRKLVQTNSKFRFCQHKKLCACWYHLSLNVSEGEEERDEEIPQWATCIQSKFFKEWWMLVVSVTALTHRSQQL